jgi:hypothetical protein
MTRARPHFVVLSTPRGVVSRWMLGDEMILEGHGRTRTSALRNGYELAREWRGQNRLSTHLERRDDWMDERPVDETTGRLIPLPVS